MRWLSAAVLVAVNLIPLVGVAFWGWSLFLILVLYWVESGIVGVLNIFKIAAARGPVSVGSGGSRFRLRLSGMAAGLARGGIIGFFIFHYGMFWLVHGIFVFLLPVFASAASPSGSSDFGPLSPAGVAVSVVGLAASHTVSFVVNYMGRGEYLRVSPDQQMISVYGRVLVLHVTIILGAAVVGFFGTPYAALVLLVGMKIVVDLFFHLREHRRAELSAS
jgi:Family of unknown function (DUF6498)